MMSKLTGSAGRHQSTLVPLLITVSTVASIALAVLLRFLNNNEPWPQRAVMYLEFPGHLYMRALQCLSVPVLIASLVSAFANQQPKLSFRIGRRTIAYYLGTSMLAIGVGVMLVLVLRPGVGTRSADLQLKRMEMRKVTSEDAIMDLLRNSIPSNLVTAFFNMDATHLTPPANTSTSNISSTDIMSWSISIKPVSTPNFLGLIVISSIVGLLAGTFARHPSNPRPLLSLLANDVNDFLRTVVQYVLLVTPLAVPFLIMPRLLSFEIFPGLFATTGRFVVTVLLGFAIHGLLLLPAIYYLVTKKNPYRFAGRVSEALLTAFGTCSSAVTMPATMRNLEERARLDGNLVRCTVPVGASVNMDGTALYEAVAAIFLAQLRNMEGMDLARVLAVSITTTVAVAGAAGIPNAGIITMAMVLGSLNVPLEDLALLIAIDFALHRFRTVINVLGDAYGAAIVEHLSREDLAAFKAVESGAQKGSSHGGFSMEEGGASFSGFEKTSASGNLAGNLASAHRYENSAAPVSPNEKITAISFTQKAGF